MFIDCSEILWPNPTQLNYGISVCDPEGKGDFCLAVCGFGFPNQLYRKTEHGFEDSAEEQFAKENHQAIGLAAADFDGDGGEELYILNTDVFMGPKRFTDHLFDLERGSWRDLFDIDENAAVLNLMAGRSVCCLDRLQTGQYSFYIANYGGPNALFELNQHGIVVDRAEELGLDITAGGRSLLSFPVDQASTAIYAANENSPNCFFIKNPNSSDYLNRAEELGLTDFNKHARGVALLDCGEQFGIVCGNWEGPHRLFIPRQISQGGWKFEDQATKDFSIPTRIRTVIVADFDNDGYEEIFMNNIGQPNRLFAYREGMWKAIDPGNAMEPRGFGTGGAVGDFNQDGRLELVLAHGEMVPQPLTCYTTRSNNHHFFRVRPCTKAGAPARGALVKLLSEGRWQRRVIDGGSGYLCQMEPVAHFGLGKARSIDRVEVFFPTGEQQVIENLECDEMITLQATK
ncbi:ASPIC and UnbV [Planctomycetales bacterium 10988]|nr:ASPIC and UnbV [Planctomycetales bacterium 10988]